MKRLLLPAAALLLLAPVPSEGAADGRRVLAELLRRVEPRMGVTHRSLVVLPLVLRDGEVAGMKEAPPPSALRWIAAGKDQDADRVEFRFPGGKAPAGSPGVAVAPSGLLLEGPRERLLSRPLLLAEGEPPPRAIARFCGVEAPDDAPGAPEERAPAGMAPTEQRKADLFHRSEQVLEDLLRVQGALGLLQAPEIRVRDLAAAPGVLKAVDAAAAALRPVAGSYGGGAAGHVAFLGARPLEFVLFREPAAYRAAAPEYLRALAVSASLWERLYGRADLPVAPVDAALLAAEARRLLSGLDESSRVREDRLRPRETGSRFLDVACDGGSTRDSWTPRLRGRLLAGAAGEALFLEVYEEADLFPAPLIGPGERPTDAPPDVSGGALTSEYLRRLAERTGSRDRPGSGNSGGEAAGGR